MCPVFRVVGLVESGACRSEKVIMLRVIRQRSGAIAAATTGGDATQAAAGRSGGRVRLRGRPDGAGFRSVLLATGAAVVLERQAGASSGCPEKTAT